MRSLEEQLSQYASYHLDRRNVATHFVGIPLIVLAVAALLARVPLTGFFSLMHLVALVAGLYYLLLDGRIGLLMVLFLAVCVAFGSWAAGQTTTLWLLLGVGGFVLGWIIQFIGHYYEGRKPAFVDDLMGLVVGPLFVVAELGFLLGLRADVQQAVEHRAGPTCIRPRKALAS